MEEGPSDGDEQIGGRAGNWESGAELGNWEWIHLLADSHTYPADASYFKFILSQLTEYGGHFPGNEKRDG